MKDVVNKMREELTRSWAGIKSKGSASAHPVAKHMANKDNREL